MNERNPMDQTGARRLLLIAAGSAAAGVHAGLAPAHLHEWAPLGASFIAAAVLSVCAVTAVALRPADPWSGRVLALVLAGLVAAYVLTRLLALPPLDPEREPLDVVGLLTVAAEAAGIVAVLRLRRRPGTAPGHMPTITQGGNR